MLAQLFIVIALWYHLGLAYYLQGDFARAMTKRVRFSTPSKNRWT